MENNIGKVNLDSMLKQLNQKICSQNCRHWNFDHIEKAYRKHNSKNGNFPSRSSKKGNAVAKNFLSF